MSTPSGEGPKLHIDSDWKSQAQAEKERLAKMEQEKRASAASVPPALGLTGTAPVGTAPTARTAGPGVGNEIPEASFDSLVGSLATQALIYLGGARDPRTGQPMVDLDVARLQIDLLGVLEEKTRGNLSQDETTRLATLLYELRMRFVSIARQVSALTAEALGGMSGEGDGVQEQGGSHSFIMTR